MTNLKYTYTNENLNAILAGIGIENKKAKALVIGGAGDVAFAILPYITKKLIVIDKNPKQIELIKLRKEEIQQKQFEKFLNYNFRGDNDSDELFFEMRKTFFSEGKRLEEIYKNIDKMIIVNSCEIFNYLKTDKGFSIIYISNILTYIKIDQRANCLRILEEALEIGGMLYISDEAAIEKIPLITTDFWPLSKDLQIKLKLNIELTNAARKFGETTAGSPVVYNKVV